MFIAVLFTIAQFWKQPKYLSVCEWVKKRWRSYTVEYYSAVKKKASCVAAWTDLESVMLSDVSQSEEDKCHDFPYLWNLMDKVNHTETNS